MKKKQFEILNIYILCSKYKIIFKNVHTFDPIDSLRKLMLASSSFSFSFLSSISFSASIRANSFLENIMFSIQWDRAGRRSWGTRTNGIAKNDRSEKNEYKERVLKSIWTIIKRTNVEQTEIS